MEQTLWLKTAADWYIFSWDKWTLTSVHFSPWFCYRESVISVTHFWITIGWEHVYVELQRNSRKAALGETPNVFYVGISSPLPFCCFFSRQSETLVEEVASWKWYWKWGTPGFQAIQVPLNTGWILHSSASLWQSACAGVWGAVVFGSLVRGFASKSNNFWTFSGLASKCSFCNGVKKKKSFWASFEPSTSFHRLHLPAFSRRFSLLEILSCLNFDKNKNCTAQKNKGNTNITHPRSELMGYSY